MRTGCRNARKWENSQRSHCALAWRQVLEDRAETFSHCVDDRGQPLEDGRRCRMVEKQRLLKFSSPPCPGERLINRDLGIYNVRRSYPVFSSVQEAAVLVSNGSIAEAFLPAIGSFPLWVVTAAP